MTLSELKKKQKQKTFIISDLGVPWKENIEGSHFMQLQRLLTEVSGSLETEGMEEEGPDGMMKDFSSGLPIVNCRIKRDLKCCSFSFLYC